MKRRGRILLILLACLAVVVSAVPFWSREKEPEYKGKKLSQWLRGYRRPPGTRVPVVSGEAVEAAVRHIGTNGLPYLVKSIEDNRKFPRWKELLFALAFRGRANAGVGTTADEMIAGRQLRAMRAVWGFEILGEDARPAIPDLVRVANGGNTEAAQLATAALAYLGKDALPPLLTLASNRVSQSHGDAMMAIGEMKYLGTNAHPAVLFLIQSIKDKQDEIGAADILSRLALESGVSVPALAGCLESTNEGVRMWGAIGLGRFGAQARTATPALLKALTDSDADVRDAATNALRQIAPETPGQGGTR